MRKRILSVLLILTMVASILSTSALADDGEGAAAAAGIPFGLPDISMSSSTDVGTVIGFDSQEWYVIGDGHSGVRPVEGHLTLLHRLDTLPRNEFETTRYGWVNLRTCIYLTPDGSNDPQPYSHPDHEKFAAENPDEVIHKDNHPNNGAFPEFITYDGVNLALHITPNYSSSGENQRLIHPNFEVAGETLEPGYTKTDTSRALYFEVDYDAEIGQRGYTNPTDYHGSSYQRHMEMIASDIMSDREVALITPATVDIGPGGGKPTENQTLWPISTADFDTIKGACALDYFDYYWLLTPTKEAYGNVVQQVGGIGRNFYLGNSLYDGMDQDLEYEGPGYKGNGFYMQQGPARPAFNLNLDRVMFATSAGGERGKSGGVVTMEGFDSLQSAEALFQAGDSVKFTMSHPEQTLSVAEADRTVAVSNGKGVLRFSGAATGMNQYVSCVITDAAAQNILYYGKLADCFASMSGEITIGVPDELLNGTYRMFVFSEQDNGENFTDFAGELIPVNFVDTPRFTVIYTDGVAGLEVFPDQVYADLFEGENTPAFDNGNGGTVPLRPGYRFAGWSPAVAETVIAPADGSTELVYTATWQKDDPAIPPYYTLYFEENGGSVIPDITRPYGTTIELSPYVPTLDGYTFTGWYLDKELTTRVTSVTLTRDITVYAGWEKNEPDEPVSPHVPGSLNGADHFSYIIGYDDGLVHPEEKITRAEVATIFFRLLKSEVRDANLTKENSFADVNDGDWYNTAVSTMASMGILKGYDGSFRPGDPITRAEFAAIAARFADAAGTAFVAFRDIAGHWAEDEILEAASLGWVEGYEGYYRPDDSITRAEAMTIINRVLCRIPETADDLLPQMIVWADNLDTGKWYYLAIQEATNSHTFAYKDDTYETWTGLTDNPDWSRYR